MVDGLPGVGDIGGDFRCSGLGIVAGFSDEVGTTMFLGLRGLSFLTTVCFTGSVDSEFFVSVLLLVPFLRPIKLACFAGLNPFTLGTRPVGRLGVIVMSPLSLRMGTIRSGVDIGETLLALLLFPLTICICLVGVEVFSITVIGTTISLPGVLSRLLLETGVPFLEGGSKDSPSLRIGMILSFL